MITKLLKGFLDLSVFEYTFFFVLNLKKAGWGKFDHLPVVFPKMGVL